MKVTSGYSGAQIGLHWLIALGVVFNYIVSNGMGRALSERLEGTPVSISVAGLHVWVGVAVLALVALRVMLRLVRGAPAAEPGAKGKLAQAVHGLLYLLMLAVPVAGALAWFGGQELLAEPHALMANALLALAGAHAAMALVHHFILKDRVLRRMVRPA